MSAYLRSLITIVVCALLAAGVSAQAAVKATDLGAPGDEHRKLDQFAGTWDVTVMFPAGPGRRMEGKSTCVASWTLDGRFLRQEYTSTFMGKPLTVVRYLGFDRHRGVYVEIQFESTHTDVLHSEGSLAADGRSITARGRHVDAAVDKVVDVRTVTTINDPDKFTVELFYGPAEGAEAKTITLVHTRRKEPEHR